MPKDLAPADAKNVTPKEPKEPELKTVTSNDVGKQTQTKSSK